MNRKATNIIKDALARLDERLEETKNPCKTYATFDAATKAAEQICEETNQVLGSETSNEPNFMVLHHSGMNRYVPVIMLNEFLTQDGCGGYVFYPASKGFWCA